VVARDELQVFNAAEEGCQAQIPRLDSLDLFLELELLSLGCVCPRDVGV